MAEILGFLYPIRKACTRNASIPTLSIFAIYGRPLYYSPNCLPSIHPRVPKIENSGLLKSCGVWTFERSQVRAQSLVINYFLLGPPDKKLMFSVWFCNEPYLLRGFRSELFVFVEINHNSSLRSGTLYIYG